MQSKCFENLPVEGRRRFICSNFSSFFSVQFPQFILGEFVKNTFDPSVVIKVLSQSRSESLLVLIVFIASVEKLCSCPAESLNFISHKLLISNTNKIPILDIPICLIIYSYISIPTLVKKNLSPYFNLLNCSAMM